MFQKISLTFGVLVLSGFSIYHLSNIRKVNAAAPCIVTISGVQYDVAPLTAPGAHPGGNIFVCGTDMTALFMSMPTHAADIARMTPYIYHAPTPTPTIILPTSTPTPTVVPTISPTVIPSVSPSVSPTSTPTVSPSVSPTVSPSVAPKHDDDQEEQNENEQAEQHENDGHRGSERSSNQGGRSSEHRNNLSIKAGLRVSNED